MSARPHVIDGKTVDPKRAVPREMSSKGEHNVSTKRLYVSGIREDHTEAALRSYFEQFGGIAQVISLWKRAYSNRKLKVGLEVHIS